MAKYIVPAYYDLILNLIKNSDRESICSAYPSTYFQACYPAEWTGNHVYSVGDTARPTVDNNFVYECTVGGTSASGEPTWPTTQDQTVIDGSVTWKAHNNYVLVSTSLNPAENLIENGDIDGRKLTIPEKGSVITYRSGTVAYTALLEDSTKTIHSITPCTTTASADDEVVASRLTTMYSIKLELRAVV